MNATLIRMAAFLVTLLLSVLFTGCGQNEQESTADPLSAGSKRRSASPEELAALEWSAESATKISLMDNEIAVDGAGAAVHRGTVTITRGGDYLMEGSLADGQLVIDAGPEDQIRLILNNAHIASKQNTAINVISGDDLAITLPAGTENSLICSPVEAGEEQAVVHTQNDLAIGGEGSLAVRSERGDGIRSQRRIVVTGGNLIVQTQGDGLRGEEAVAITGGRLTLDSQGRGIGSQGEVIVNGGLVQIAGSGQAGEEAMGRISVQGGVLLATEDCAVESIGGPVSQPVLTLRFDTPQQADTLVNLSTADGANLFSFLPLRPYRSIVVSMPSFEIGGQYVLSTGGSDSGNRMVNLYYGGEYQGGMPVLNITLSDGFTSVEQESEALDDAA